MSNHFFKFALALASLIISSNLYANVIINGTRVVFPGDKKEISLKIQNENKLPVLVQTWVDDGNSEMSKNMPKTPFTILPPMFRMEANQGQSLRILYNGQPLAKDRESVFWVNVFEIPPNEAKSQSNSLQLAFRSRIKLFFRPASLDAPVLDNLAQGISCTAKKISTSQTALSCHNPSPYFISFSKVSLFSANVEIPLSLERFGMIKPYSDVTENISNSRLVNNLSLRAYMINDQGGIKQAQIKVTYE